MTILLYSRLIFEATKSPLVVPISGGFPVDLITHVGEPIRKKEGESVLELKLRVETSLKSIIEKNRGKQSVLGALSERFLPKHENIYESFSRNIVFKLNKIFNFV